MHIVRHSPLDTKEAPHNFSVAYLGRQHCCSLLPNGKQSEYLLNTALRFHYATQNARQFTHGLFISKNAPFIISNL